MPIARYGSGRYLPRLYPAQWAQGLWLLRDSITLLRTIPTIVNALRAGAKDLARGAAAAAGLRRTDRDHRFEMGPAGLRRIASGIMWALLTF